jgi:hypothetical protein
MTDSEGMKHLSSKLSKRKKDEKPNFVFLVRVSLLQVKPIIPSTPELQNWEDMDKRIPCLITINH